MRNQIQTLILACSVLIFGCTKIEITKVTPLPPETYGLDTNYYPGNWANYVSSLPSFETPNFAKNLNIELFTGHKALYNNARNFANDMKNDHPNRVVITTIHGTPNIDGISDYQTTDAIYSHDFTSIESKNISKSFRNGWGYTDLPAALFNRTKYFTNGNYRGFFRSNIDDIGYWDVIKDIEFDKNDISIQAVSNYYESTNGGFLHVEIEAAPQFNTNYEVGLVVNLVQKSIIAPQKTGSTSYSPAYEHHYVYLGSLDGNTFGTELYLTDTDRIRTIHMNYNLPENINPNDVVLQLSVIGMNFVRTYQSIEIPLQ